MHDILGFGACAVDDLLFVDEFPRPDGKTRVTERVRVGGGLAATALVAASRLGLKTAWCGTLGDDGLSRFSLDELGREGVGARFVRSVAGARPHYSVIVIENGSGRRSILACNDGVVPFPVEEVGRELIGGCKAVFVDHTVVDTAIRVAQIARELGVPVVADVERANAPGLAGLLPLIDHLIVGSETGRTLTGHHDPAAIVEALMAPLRRCVVVTAGERGCWFAGPDEVVCHQPAFEVEVVDTTGCGDVFHGAYMVGLLEGLGVAESVRLASAAAAMKAREQGGRRGIPTREQLNAFLAVER